MLICCCMCMTCHHRFLREEAGDVDAVLSDLGLDEMALQIRRLHVYNKIDAAPEGMLQIDDLTPV